jgi:hypothetical protein
LSSDRRRPSARADKERGRLCRPFSAPRETRTPTPHKQDKALNLVTPCPVCRGFLFCRLLLSLVDDLDASRRAFVTSTVARAVVVGTGKVGRADPRVDLMLPCVSNRRGCVAPSVYACVHAPKDHRAPRRCWRYRARRRRGGRGKDMREHLRRGRDLRDWCGVPEGTRCCTYVGRAVSTRRCR